MNRGKIYALIAAAIFLALCACGLYYINDLIRIMKGMTVWLVDTIGHLGYTGIVALMFLESSFFPFPSEVVMPPAGYLIWKGNMTIWAVLASGLFGSILGALFNYWIAVKVGRPFLHKYGKYFFVSSESMDKADVFFARHGHISTLVGRLIPVIRQYISLPAGLARMNMSVFLIFTSIGAGIWVAVLTYVGYALGEHQELLDRYLHVITISCVGGAVLLVALYVLWYRFRKAKTSAEEQ